MTIHYSKDGTTLTMKPEGRLDTMTSPEFERRTQPETAGMKEIIMDFEQVEYISSGGLRVLLALEQKMEDCGGSIRVIHVNDYIMEVFELTGFLDILTVE